MIMDDRPDIRSLSALRAAEAACRRCPLYRNATQVVPGEGPARARVMLVGEQPGDQEDRQGRPFVGPAGRILDRAIVVGEHKVAFKWPDGSHQEETVEVPRGAPAYVTGRKD